MPFGFCFLDFPSSLIIQF
uniref:Uncharacterized protein n=1 Tax=Rhizophora mucronata TaxID=61149 RepID=A0A2P2P7W2_RHIMU